MSAQDDSGQRRSDEAAFKRKLKDTLEKSDKAYVSVRLREIIGAGSAKIFSTAAAFLKAMEDTPLDHKSSDIGVDEFRKFVNGSTQRLNPEKFAAVVEFLLRKGLYYPHNRAEEISKSFPDPVFHALADFMGVGNTTLGNLRYRAPGIYRAYRPSSTYPGMFWIGMLEIRLDTVTGVVTTREIYKAPRREGRPRMHAEFIGYFFRKGRHHFMVSRDTSRDSIALVLFSSNSRDQKERLLTLRGGVLDMSRGRPYYSRVFYERHDVDDRPDDDVRAELLSQAEVVTEDEMPKSILNWFLNKQIPGIFWC